MFTFISSMFDKSATERWLQNSELGLLGFGVLLVVGLFGEMKSTPHSSRYKVSEWLVILGVAGELLADGGIFFFSHRLQDFTDKEVAALNLRANQAIRDSSNANERASVAEERSEAYELGIAQAKARASELMLEVEKEKTARLKIEARMAFRSLTGEERTELLAALRSINGARVPILFNSTAGNIEAKQYADQISTVFAQAGLEVTHSESSIGNPEFTGVSVLVSFTRSTQQAKDAAVEVLGALRKSGIRANHRGGVDFGVFNDRSPQLLTVVEIVVGQKPLE